MFKEERRQRSFYDAVYEARVAEGHFVRRLERFEKCGVLGIDEGSVAGIFDGDSC